VGNQPGMEHYNFKGQSPCLFAAGRREATVTIHDTVDSPLEKRGVGLCALLGGERSHVTMVSVRQERAQPEQV